MSIDGGFNLKSELQRFLARCSDLKSNTRLISLVQKGDEVTEDEVVSSLAELFLNRKYTIPLLGCFRAIAGKIVNKAVDLLRLVSSNDSRISMDIDDDDNNPYLIESYVRSGRSLELHEAACFAFCRALDLAPYLLRSVLRYFKFSHPPFQRLMDARSASRLIAEDGAQLLDAVRVSFRLLLIDPQVFSELWNWSSFLDLVQQSTELVSGKDSDMINIGLDIRWCAIQILSITLKMSDKARLKFGLDAEKTLASFFRWEEFCQDVSLEKAGWYLDMNLLEMGKLVDTDVEFSGEYCLWSSNSGPLRLQSNEIEPLRKNKKQTSSYAHPLECPFVLTSAVKKSFEMVWMAVSQKWPVLIYGPTGSGKTALINYLAQVSRNRVLSIHMDEQMDGKTLIGNYVCTEKPGEFRWQAGSLTQAITNGFWVVFEDIDKAPSDVQSILLPLLEGANSFVTGRGEEISVAENFRLFGTMSTFASGSSHNSEGKSVLGVLWRSVMINPSTKEDLLHIINKWYPNLEGVSTTLIETYEWITSSHLQHFAASQSFNRFSLRDLLKWCKRIASLGFLYPGHGLSVHEQKTIFQEAIDIFVASFASSKDRLCMMKELAKIWGVPAVEAENPFHKPIIQEFKSELQIGRATLNFTRNVIHTQKRPFVDIPSSLYVLERIACSVKHHESVLLVGETGTGKTTLVQNLANRLGQPLIVLNLSQQSDVADLLGGLKPTDPQFLCIPLYNEFLELFPRTFSKVDNPAILGYLRKQRTERNWKKILEALQRGLQKVLDLQPKVGVRGSGKRKRPLGEELLKAWERFADKLNVTRQQIDASSGIAFQYVEGAFVSALRNGHWILLDEVNLAPPETLQRIMGVLEGESGSLCLAERGDVDYIERHRDFRLFACMNPATDAGKRDLPYSVRSRFTEYFVDEILNDEDLTLFINQFLDESCPNRELVSKIVQFYKAAKRESQERLQDGANQRPQFSLRSLYRALEYVKKAARRFGFQKAVYDGFCMFFLTLLDGPSAKHMDSMIRSELLGGSVPPDVPFNSYLTVAENSKSVPSFDDYVLTDSVTNHLRNLSRAVLIRRYPILLQGPTSSGKTSLVRHLAAITGHEFVRINNHEHTDLQEYLGSYVTDATGKLVFQEGVLVKAVRSGRWIVLDELNLAPSDVLEALNRLLDDNREIFVPELQETIKAHPNFMLFATQNPPTIYGGRKMLSRAFRNRFVEIHVDEIPENELITILKERCKIPETYAKKMVDVMKDLQLHRQSSKIFAGKHGFITPRDLFRWANRYRELGQSCEDLVKDGYYLLAERLRDENEKEVVRKVLEQNFRPEKLNDALLYKEQVNGFTAYNGSGVPKDHQNVIWTTSMQRLYFLVERCYKLREPVLLVGETAGGKTTVCQLLSAGLGRNLHILNCHQFTETSDFLGGFYPVRDRSMLILEFKDVVEQLMLSHVIQGFPNVVTLSSDISEASLTLSQLNDITSYYQSGQLLQTNVTKDDLDRFGQMRMKLIQLHQRWQTIFIWHDGALVQAMKSGDLFLVDEISLADDSVLERLNSVLEPERKLSLAEKGGSMLENIIAHPNFFLLATMNPGGDYGKKELSPALRNRFTEIWVPPVSDSKELRSIALSFAGKSFSYAVDPMLKFWEWFSQFHTSRMLTVRDLLSWVDFMNATEKLFKSPNYAFLHGAFLVLLDGLSLGTGISKHAAGKLREQCLSFLLQCLEGNFSPEESELSKLETFGWGDIGKSVYNVSDKIVQSDQYFGITPFFINKGDDDCKSDGFEFLSPTTCTNAMRVLRAMQLTKPVLLEGSPGVGKTSLIVALGKFSGHRVVRINLSEQTDIMDLLGSDLPVDDTDGMKFAWSDGILLQALKNGDWVLLDELNLAPQSVLEGLNAILDHRAEVFIPELGHTYQCPPSFRVFACQNPSCQGGGRKGLPKSFLNRFTKVYMDELVEDDYLYICSSLHPLIPKPLLQKLILFNSKLFEDTMISRKYGLDGSPWEFNLRDVLRSCEIIEGAPEKSKEDCFLNIVYIQRMRTATDRQEVKKLYEEVFDVNPFINPYPRMYVNPRYLIVGNTFVERNNFQAQPSQVSKSLLNILPGIRHSLEAVAHCVKHQWLCILVGPSASGKTSVVRLLANLTGNVLNELNLSSATDISELLGCFEQYNAFRNFRSAISQVERYIDEYFSVSLESSSEALFHERKDLVSKWFKFVSSSASAHAESWSGSYDSLGLLIQIIEELKHGLERYQLPVAWSSSDLNDVLKTVINLLEYTKQHSFPAKFEWVTGLLIKAIERGEWIVLENANLCNPTVLDRINSLVEPSGSITVNECGLVNGRPVVLIPNGKFRLFLTVNPRYGEVSRAMRNRGVEIFMMQPDWINERKDGFNCKEAEMNDVKRFLVLSGIPLSLLVDMMSEAHIFARNTGVDLGVQITLVELTRWVQLFQQLLLNGNRALWSLQVSWEHTYLSSLGEFGGKSAVEHAKISFLSASKLSKLDAFLSHSLSLPGGWPTPLRLRNFVWHSKEACVKQNCTYLEFLCAQCASYESSGAHDGRLSAEHSSLTGIGDRSTSLLNMDNKLNPSLISLKMLLQMLFPTTSYQQNSGCSVLGRFDSTIYNKMITFAANWTIQQASEGDFKLYLLRFNQYNSQLHPYCHFSKSYMGILNEELDHPIWNSIFDSRRELMSHYKIDVDMHPLPVLSLKLLDLTVSDGCLQRLKKRLCHSVRCVDLLRTSIQQWKAEDEHNSLKENHFSLVLESLRALEKEVLDKLFESLSFDDIIEIFPKVIEDHSLLWNAIITSKYESMIISWRTLKKDARQLHRFFPEAVQDLLVQSTKMVDIAPWISQSIKSLLWAYGGHPLLPSSAEAYAKMQQLLSFFQLVWPRDAISQKLSSSGNYVPLDVIVSTNTELRLLAMQGIGMTSFLSIRDDQDETCMVQQLEEMHQILLRRFEHEKQNMEALFVSSPQSFMEKDVSECCVFCPEKSHKLSFNSWQELFCLFDSTSFFLDMGLLKELSSAVVVEKEQLYKVLSNTSNLLETSLSFSLKFSSRSPKDFIPHQTLLWALDAWESVDSVNTKIASSILEMWFRWHSLLWRPYTELFKVDGGNSPLPHMLFQPARAATLDRILKSAFPIKEFDEQRLKLRIASGNLWHDFPLQRDLSDILLSSARSLFEQIIYAHKKSFDKEKYDEIKSIIGSIQGCDNKDEQLQSLFSLISSSSHSRLTSLKDSLISQLLKELYLQSSHNFLGNIGCAWLHIGSLRFHLLLTPGDLDPAIKYAIRHSQIVERISVLQLEIKVHQECESLVGRSSDDDVLKQRTHLLDELDAERKRLKRKVVYREDASQFTRLKSECADFLRLTTYSSELAKNVTAMGISELVSKAFNWQETASSFIYRLSEEYASYADITQPVQVAVYEMKLGLSLVVSSALQNTFLSKMEDILPERIMETIYGFIQFPRCFSLPFINNDASNKCSDHLLLDQDVSSGSLAVDINLLERLCTISRDNVSDKMPSVPQSQATLCHNIFVRLTHEVVNSRLLGHKTFKILNQIFDKFAGVWMSMKIQTKEKEDNDARNYRFKTRKFKIEDILEVDVSSLKSRFDDDSLCIEWQEMMQEDESSTWVGPMEHENLAEEWGLIQESILDSMVRIHGQFFGSCNLVQRPGFNQISDAEKLSSFRESFKLGLAMLKVVPALLSSSLDTKIVPEHLLSLCLDYKEKFGQLHRPGMIYNIYKDSNAPLMSKMLNPLIALQRRVLSLLKEWPDHPGLQNILSTVEMLLGVPLSTPIAKVLSGLQFLLAKSHQLEENAPKLSLSEQMQPILVLVTRWLKMELESWPALLDGIQEQYEINSRKLWFPLYSVLYRGQTADISEDIQSSIQSLEEFLQTSSIGEFKSRLQLLLAFHGQIRTGLKFYSCRTPMEYMDTENTKDMENLKKHMENMVKVLYNVFGYYVQFLPIVSEHIEAIRKSISVDLTEIVKLYNWERDDNHLLMETTKRIRQKLRKHIQKFNDVLQQPVMVILNKEAAKGGTTVQSPIKKKVSADNFDKSSMLSPISVDLKPFSETERLILYTDWRKKIDFAMEYWSPENISCLNLQYLCVKDVQETEGCIRDSLNCQSACPIFSEEWKELWILIERIYRTITECADLWEIEKKSFGKRRALSDLLKLLGSCGLSRHKSIVSEDVLNSSQPSNWFLQPSYDVQHLLLPPIAESTIDDVTSSSQFQLPHNENFDSDWKVSNEYYFRSMARVQLLRQICLNFHKDFSLDQVTRSASFLEHLILMQQEQRSFAYTFSEELMGLKNSINILEDLHTKPSFTDYVPNRECFVAFKQSGTQKCMWRQKKLFDNLYSISHDTSLLLRNVEVAHLETCQTVKVAANSFLAFIEQFIPKLQKSKESLDKYLLGSGRIFTSTETFSRPFIVSKQMEELVMQNFQLIGELEGYILAFSKQNRRSVKDLLIGRFIDVLNQGKDTMQETFSDLEQRNKAIRSSVHSSSSDPEAEFAKSFSKTVELLREVFQKLGLSNGHANKEDFLSANITQWKVLAESFRTNIKLDLINRQLGATITSAVHLIEHVGSRTPNICDQIQSYLHYLKVLVDPILTLGNGFLLEFLFMNRAVGEMTHMLANVFASLFSKGFGASSEDQADDTRGDVSQDASGTGMGEGAGVNDVSDQIEDEDQLLGDSKKPDEGIDTSNEPPSKQEKGIEMKQDFEGDTCSVSEDSGEDDNEDSDSEKLDTAMGNTGDDNEVVDEKLWNKDDEENPDTKNEKYESGPSVTDFDSSSRELRAKEDVDPTLDKSGDIDADKSDKDTKKDGEQNGPELDEEMDDLKLDKDAAYEDPTDIQMDDQNHVEEENTDMEGLQDADDTTQEAEGTDPLEERGPEDLNETGEDENGETTQLNKDTENTESGKENGDFDGDDSEDHDEVPDMELLASSKNVFDQGESYFNGNSVPSANCGIQLNADGIASESSDMASNAQRHTSEDMQNGLAPSVGLPPSTIADTQLTMPDSVKGGKLTAEEPEPPSLPQDNSSVQTNHPNPYRSVGDALEKWKERVKVSIDAQENKKEVHDEMEDCNADEYGFVPESEKGTSQALGPATSEQIDSNIKGSNLDADEDLTEHREDVTEMNVDSNDAETLQSRSHSALMQKLDDQMQNSGLKDKTPVDEMREDDGSGAGNGGDGDDSGIMSRNLVTIKKANMDEEMLQLSNLTIDDNELGKAKALEMSGDVEGDAATLWRRYEQLTTRLSQELAEQLRLVMEPTVASKLQGDYKTGKRINMKKVIAYLASYYRKDKIWLRRTRPNKRDYQVVVAIDDSRSMSESNCGDVAIEALVTVCRAMSQLEVAQLAVASFGTKGNIQLLHDFNQQFTGEAGKKMISSLTFKQENTIQDKPMLDLLQYLNSMLDAAGVNSRLPSGQSPLQQLVLIISDGFLHEKEKLKRYVRDLLSKNRMVAFVLIDNPQVSITDLTELSFEGGKVTQSKYLNSFPFPYYIVLKDIEALPRTLADLLRQWFELMQNARD